MAAGSSPRKLQRSIWNQIAPSSPPSASGSGSSTSAGPDDVTLSLRKLSLSPPAFPSSPSPSSPHSRVLSAVLTQAQPRSKAITTLDLSYSILDPHSLAKLCSLCSRVRCLIAVECGLSDTLPDTQWPRRLCKINLSRNNFHRIPQGFENLLYLRELNLSGNQVDHVAPAVLQLPLLERLHLLRNPVRNIPKAVCLSGVQHMRDFLQVQPLPPPSPEDSDDVPSAVRRLSLEDGRNLRRTLLKRRLESLESGYDSGTRMLSTTSSCSSDSEAEKDTPEEPLPIQTWPKFAPSFLPQGYTEVSGSHTVLCQVYLPPGSTSGSVLVEEVKDLSLHPQLASNELLVTPVVRVSPHGLKFRADQPAIVVLPHCTRPSGGTAEEVVVLCSNTGPCELPQWRRVCEGMCDMFESSVKFSTTHFSLFAVISTMPYHSAELVISSNEGGSLTLPECPGFQVKFPAGSLMTERGEETITATIYYADSPLNGASSDPRGASPDPHGASPDPHGASPNQEEEVEGLALASPVVGLEPHGIHFSQPVEVTLPVPDYAAIKSALPEASLQLWTASHEALSWSRLVETQLSVDLCRDGQHTVSFSVPHFTFFELLWDTCRDTLMRLGYGAAVVYRSLRARYVAVRCQVFMTPPQLDLTFALLVVVYKFGERLSELGNYPWMLADSGDRQVFLRTGELEAALNGCFEPRTEYGETSLSQSQTLGFTGQDFSLRFAFSLKLSSLHSLLADYQVIGKLQLRQGSGGTAMQLNLIKPAGTAVGLPEPTTPPANTSQQMAHYIDLTPPWSPENYNPVPNEEEDPLLIGSHTTHLAESATNKPCRAGKRKAQTSDYLLPHSRAKRKLLVIQDEDISDKLLMQIAKCVGPKYEELGIALGLPSATVDSVAGGRGEGLSEHMRAFHVLQEWKRVAAESLTFATLAAALEEAGLNSCARDTCYATPLDTCYATPLESCTVD